MKRLSLCFASLALISTIAPTARAYDAEIHQQLTFIAARQFNQCVQYAPGMRRLSALDTRYVVKANVAQEDRNFFTRIWRWDYYNRDGQKTRTSLGLIDTRFHDHFDKLVSRLEDSGERSDQLRNLGRILNHVQNVSSPAHAVPVYAGRWWRFSPSDRFNKHPVDTQRVELMVAKYCAAIVSPTASLQEILVTTADDTAAAVRNPIYGFPATWESYWRFAAKMGDFGEYGAAGNSFGARTEFKCGDGQHCLLLENDPLYADFAVQRHVDAVVATMRAISLLQVEDPI